MERNLVSPVAGCYGCCCLCLHHRRRYRHQQKPIDTFGIEEAEWREELGPNVIVYKWPNKDATRLDERALVDRS